MIRLTIIFLLFLTGAQAAQEPPDFEREVLPVLYHHCFSCHSEKQAKPKGGLLLDSMQGIQAGDVLTPGKPEKSELLMRACLPVTDEDVMPPIKGGAQPLSEMEQKILRRWIASGASFGRWQKFNHRGPVMPAIDSAITVGELTSKIDDLVQAHHRKHGTSLNAPVSDEVFLRRVYLDIVGRIPSLEESTRFLDDQGTQVVGDGQAEQEDERSVRS